MTAPRVRLPNRRSSQQLSFECNSLRYVATVPFFADGNLAEIFICNAKAFGVPVDVIRKALLRDGQGNASSPLGAALDRVTELKRCGNGG